MYRKLSKISIIALLVFLLAISMVIAASVTTVRSPASNSNNKGTVLFNIVVSDNATGNSTANVTVFGIFHNAAGAANGSIIVFGTNTSVNSTNYNLSIDTTAIPAGIYNITVNATHENGTQYVVQNTSVVNVTIDNTGPTIRFMQTAPSNYANQSFVDANITFNVTDNTALSGINCTLYINTVYNQSKNSSANNSVNGLYNFTSASIAQGNYLFNVTCMDRTANLGSNTLNITFDTAPPSVPNITLSKTSVPLGDSLTVDCVNQSDNVENVRLFMNVTIKRPEQSAYEPVSNGTSITLVPRATYTDTSALGEYNIFCNVTDSAGNTNTSNLSFSVIPKLLNRNAVATTVPSAGVPIITSGSISDVGDISIASGHRLMAKTATLKFTLNNEEHSLYLKDLTDTSTTFTLSSDPIEITLAPGDKKSYDLDGDKINDVTITLNAISRGKADVTVSVAAKQPAEKPAEQTGTKTTSPAAEKGSKSYAAIFWIIVVLVLLVIILFILKRRGSGKVTFTNKDLGGGQSSMPPYQGNYVQPRQQQFQQNNDSFRYQ